MKNRKQKAFACTAAALSLALFGACSGGEYREKPLSENAVSLTASLVADKSVRTGNSGEFSENNLAFSTDFFRRSYTGGNTLVSPLSLAAALAMTANGARGETLSEMERVLGMSKESLNVGLSAYLDKVAESGALSVADSLWLRDTMKEKANADFLQRNKDYYDAEIYAAPFDKTTVSDINTWTENATRGMIKELIQEISPDSVAYLINALYFSGEWQNKYEKSDIAEGMFTAADGTASRVKTMKSSEGIYLSDENTTGFVKAYKGGEFAFAAFLPAEEISINEYVAGFSAEKWQGLFGHSSRESVICTMPAFSYDFSVTANGILKDMGMPTAFDAAKADFSGMFDLCPEENVYIGEVLQKTRIEVNEAGTKAAAVTEIGMKGFAAPNKTEIPVKIVILDRPFVYAIIDRENNYPIFLGAVTKL